MAIHVVKPGDNLYSIARAYGVSPERIAADNAIDNPAEISVGQALLVSPGQRLYTVRPGDSVYGIARRFGVTQNDIIAANPLIGINGRINAGEQIIIPSGGDKKIGTIEVNGYIFPGSNLAVVTSALNSLTYLSIFSYEVKADGSLNTIDDEKWIALARRNHVAPVMVITNIRQGGRFNSDITRDLFASDPAQNNLIGNIETVMKQKNYSALNIDFEYIYPSDRQNYNRFLQKITSRMHALGYEVFTALAPKISATQAGTLYEAHDYAFHGRTVDRIILMTYEWGYLAGPPQAVAPLSEVRKVLNYAVTEIPRDKILMGVPNYAYDWTLPFVRGTLAKTFSNIEAPRRAFRNKAEIRFDADAQSPYFTYYDENKKQHIVWFDDVRSIRSKLLLVNEYGLAGISFWTAERPFPQGYLMLNSLYTIKKVI